MMNEGRKLLSATGVDAAGHQMFSLLSDTTSLQSTFAFDGHTPALGDILRNTRSNETMMVTGFRGGAVIMARGFLSTAACMPGGDTLITIGNTGVQ